MLAARLTNTASQVMIEQLMFLSPLEQRQRLSPTAFLQDFFNARLLRVLAVCASEILETNLTTTCSLK
jgi:hypothetical protein